MNIVTIGVFSIVTFVDSVFNFNVIGFHFLHFCVLSWNIVDFRLFGQEETANEGQVVALLSNGVHEDAENGNYNWLHTSKVTQQRE